MHHVLLSCGKCDTIADVDTNVSQSGFSCPYTRGRPSLGTAHIQGHATAETMAKINVVPSMPALLVLMFQVGNFFLLVKGRPVITIVCEKPKYIFAVVSLLS